MRSPLPEVEDEESKALLSSEESQDSGQLDTAIVEAIQSDTWSPAIRYSLFCVFLTAVALVTHFFGPTTTTHPNLAFHGSELRSNGTHDFKRTVLMVSIDGLRCVHRHWQVRAILNRLQCRLSRPWFNSSFIGYQQERIEGQVHDICVSGELLYMSARLCLSFHF